MIVGMAGHVDHGKSVLVTALTGAAMDRLEEERRRGITIDLNFAPLPLADGTVAGVIDVPGHEDFVRTMVAGASGVDLVLLVIAADEGIMPQTLEHLAVVEHLRVPAGIPVLTKADLVTPERVAELSDSVGRWLADSPIAFEQPVAVSARTGEGLDKVRSLILATARRLRPRARDDVFRLPVDRAFSVAGVGTVVTGTAWSGTLEIGDEVVVLPAGIRGRVRSVEHHGRPVRLSVPGARTAVGLAGVEKSAVARGATLVTVGVPWPVTSALDAELSLHPDAPHALESRSRIRVLLGTAEVMARVFPRTAMKPGHTAPARLALERPLVARGGDRFVVRSYSPIATIGGGRVLDPLPPRRAQWPAGLGAVDHEVRMAALLERRPAGIPERDAALLLGLPPVESLALLRRDAHARRIGERWIASTMVTAMARRAVDILGGFHGGQPASPGMPLETLRRSLRAPEPVARAALEDLESEGRIRVAAGVASLAEFRVAVEGGEGEIERVVRLLEQADLAPPSIGQMAEPGGLGQLTAVLRIAAERGLVHAVERDRYYATAALERFSAALLEAGRTGPISPAVLRDRLGLSRKYLIPLLEWADRQGLTVRMAEGRRLARAR